MNPTEAAQQINIRLEGTARYRTAAIFFGPAVIFERKLRVGPIIIWRGEVGLAVNHSAKQLDGSHIVVTRQSITPHDDDVVCIDLRTHPSACHQRGESKEEYEESV